MGIQGVDYSAARPGGAALKAAGKQFAVRYVPYGTTGKSLTSAERQDLHDNALSVAMVYEAWAGRALDGRSAGKADAQYSDGELRKLGFPTDTPVYFAVDIDAQANQQPAIDAYLTGAAEALGPARVGVYGGYYVIKRCRDNRTATWLWQTYAWSGGNVHPDIHLYQYRNASNLAGNGPGDLDLTEAKMADFGQWKAPGFIPGLPYITDQMIEFIRREFPTARITDVFRPDDHTDYHGDYGQPRGCAIDIAGVEPDPDGNPLTLAITQRIAERYPKSTELIHTPAGPQWQMKNGQRGYPYSSSVQAAHNNHIHWAYNVPTLPDYAPPPQEEEDMPYADWPKADKDALLNDIESYSLGHFSGPTPGGGRNNLKDLIWRTARIEAKLATLVDPAAIAAQVVATLPAGSIDQATVEAGVRAVLGSLDSASSPDGANG